VSSQPLTVLIIEDSPDYAELVQHWLSGSADEPGFTLHWSDSLAGGVQRLARGGVDVVLLDLNLPDSGGVETFLSLRAKAGEIPVVILSGADDEPQALRLIQEGADNYLVKSACERQLLTRALRYAVVKHSQATRTQRETNEKRAKVITVMAAKGGAGATTVACLLAAELRRQTEERLLFVDLDRDGGLAAFLTGVEPKYPLDYAVGNLHRLDRSFWDALITVGTEGFHFLGASSPTDGAALDAGKVKEVIARTRSWYEWLVLDVGRLNSFSTGLLEESDELVVVARTSLPELYQAKRTVEALGRAGVGGDRIRLVVNEAGHKKSFSQSELRRVFGVEVYATMPDASEELQAACLGRRLPAPATAIRRETAKVARRIACLPETKPSGMLLSLTKRFRKAESGAPGADRHRNVS